MSRDFAQYGAKAIPSNSENFIMEPYYSSLRIDTGLLLGQAERFFETGMLLLDEYPDLAIKEFIQAVEIAPLPEYFIHLASAYATNAINCGDNSYLEDAVLMCEYAIESDSNYGQAYHDKGCYLVRLGQLEDAIKCFETALSTSNLPCRAETYLNIGMVQEKFGLWTEAKAAYKSSWRYSPSFHQGFERYKRLISFSN